MKIKPTNISKEEKIRIFKVSLKNQTPYIEKEPVKILSMKRGEWLHFNNDDFIFCPIDFSECTHEAYKED